MSFTRNSHIMTPFQKAPDDHPEKMRVRVIQLTPMLEQFAAGNIQVVNVFNFLKTTTNMAKAK